MSNNLIEHYDVLSTYTLAGNLSDLIDDSELPPMEQEEDEEERTEAIKAYMDLALAITGASIMTPADAVDALNDADSPILIADKYFEDYAQDYAEEIGAINDDVKWPNNHIDWEAAAEELQSDYTSVTFDGNEYWYL
jgi:antirestriction protein